MRGESFQVFGWVVDGYLDGWMGGWVRMGVWYNIVLYQGNCLNKTMNWCDIMEVGGWVMGGWVFWWWLGWGNKGE